MTRALLCVPLLLLACSSGKPPRDFPERFAWGAAVAGFQVDMGCPTLPAEQCEDRRSDWYEFVTTSELPDTNGYVARDPLSRGPGFWELYEQDLTRAKDELHLGSVRLSLEWSRLFPTATDALEGYEALRAAADPDALAGYHRIFAAMKARGLSPLVTLNHYTLPTWLHDGVGCHKSLANCTRRGWLDKERAVREISKYAGFAAREFGGEVDTWATLNEPFAVVLSGYIFPGEERANPPAVTLQYEAARTAMLAMIEAHARMYDAVHAADTADADGDGAAAQVGLVYAMAPAKPKDPASALDVRGAKQLFYVFNTAFLDAVCKGELDEALSGRPTRREALAGRMDYLGVNYYTRLTVAGAEEPQFAALSSMTAFNPVTLSLWEDYPRGLYEMALHVKERYGLPIIVTENGTVDPKDDGTGESFLTRHVAALADAVREGADVRGYYWWTLIDNYEWNHGMGMRFGLYGVDPADPSKARTARRTVSSYARIIDAAQ